MKNKNEKEKGFYVRANEESGGDNRTAESSQQPAKSGQKTSRSSGSRQQDMKKGKTHKKKEGSARFSTDEEISAKETENIEQEDQDDQS
jgi:hypothetical protein